MKTENGLEPQSTEGTAGIEGVEPRMTRIARMGKAVQGEGAKGAKMTAGQNGNEGVEARITRTRLRRASARQAGKAIERKEAEERRRGVLLWLLRLGVQTALRSNVRPPAVKISSRKGVWVKVCTVKITRISVLCAFFLFYGEAAWAQTRSEVVVSNATGVLVAPANFFAANSNLLNQAVNNNHGGGGGSTNGLAPLTNANLHNPILNGATNGVTGLPLADTSVTNGLAPASALAAQGAAISNTFAPASSVASQLEIGGQSDEFFGLDAGQTGMTGVDNSGLGAFALENIWGGSYNTALGEGALTHNISANDNTAVGCGSLAVSTTGFNNSALGYQSGLHLTTGNNNTALGYLAGRNLTTTSNNIEIGNGGAATDQGQIRLGTPGQQTNTILSGDVSTTSNITALLNVTAGGQFSGPATGLTGIPAAQLTGSLSGGTLGSATNGVMSTNIASGSTSSNYLATVISAFGTPAGWVTGAVTNNLSTLLGQETANITNTMTVYFPTNSGIVINMNNGLNGGGEGDIVTNASFTLSDPVNVSATNNNSFVLHVHNTSGGVITITGKANWHPAGAVFNCTNNMDIWIHSQQNVNTNIAGLLFD